MNVIELVFCLDFIAGMLSKWIHHVIFLSTMSGSPARAIHGTAQIGVTRYAVSGLLDDRIVREVPVKTYCINTQIDELLHTMFSQNANKGTGPHTRKRTGPRAQSRLSSTGASIAAEPSPTVHSTTFLAPSSGQSRKGSMPLHSASINGRNRSTTPLTRGINTLQALSITEEQTIALEEGLKQVTQPTYGLSILLQDDFHVVTAYSQLPSDVEQMLSESDLNLDAFKAHVDHWTGFAYVWSREACHVWNFVRRTSAPPTCYVFPCPLSRTESVLVNTLAPLPLASLISLSSTSTNTRREPGLLLVSPTGELRAWDSLSLALSGVDKFTTIQVQLHEAELVRCLQPLPSSPGSFILATSHSRLLRIAVSPGATGRPTVTSSLMSRTQTWGSKISTLMRWGQTYDPEAGVTALAIGSALDGDTNMGGGEIWALEGRGTLQRWRMEHSGSGERLLSDYEIRPIILENLVPYSEVDMLTMAEQIDLSLLDLSVTSSRDLAILVSYVDARELPEVSSSIKPRSFAIIILDIISTTASPTVAHAIKLQHREYPDPRLQTAPTLSLPHGGPAAFICFPERLIAVSLTPGTVLEQMVSLKSGATNRIIGGGTENLSNRSAVESGDKLPTLKVLTTASGILEIELNPSELQRPMPLTAEERIDRATFKLKTKLDQAVFFGDKEENPIAFTLESEAEGDLGAAAEQISKEILSSSAKNLPPIVDLRAQLSDRSSRLHTLIKFVNATGMLNKLSRACKRTLMSDAELLSATHALWLHQNLKMNALSQFQRPNSTFLSQVIASYMNSIQRDDDEDVIRGFFRTQSSGIIDLLEHSQSQLKSTLSVSSHTPNKRAVVLIESNEIIVTIYSAAASFRQAHDKLYDLRNDISTSPWTSLVTLLDILQYHYDATLNVIQQRFRDFGPTIDEENTRFGGGIQAIILAEDEDEEICCNDRTRELQVILKTQLVQLAEDLLAMMNERIAFLQSTLGASHAETKVLNDRYLRVRPLLIMGLVKINKPAKAFGLAEEQRDFRTLVELCHNSTFPGSERRVPLYIERFKKEFAFQLYQWYVEHGRYLDLLTQDAAYAPLVTSFLDNTDYGKISWIHDLAIGRFDHAASVLVNEGLASKDLDEQKLMLSLGKLCQVSQIGIEDLKSEQTLRAIEAIDDRLDIVDAQFRLVGLCTDIIGSHPQYSLQTIDNQVEVLKDNLAPNLSTRPAFAQLFGKSLRHILEGNALRMEDLIDMYSLKANLGEQMEDFITALDAFSRAKELVPGRAHLALQSVWRRIYIHEDWHALRKSTNLSDEDVTACLKSTALYHVLSNVLNADDRSETGLQILSPNECFFDASTNVADNLAIRFSEHSTFELEQLVADYQEENNRLEELIESAGLMEYHAEILRLIQEDDQEDFDDSDVTMN
ncbi:Non-repetitive/WGA-negative nucleoporin C-terminal-domain-containing protein [Melampsora americana]|nr:Non-repetitive/WGA-negative nucleoporin C-terminal-domain-containing protein [Melampsora americana]